MSYLVTFAFVVILGSLAFDLYFMMRGGQSETVKSKRMARALAMRVGFSILLFVCVLVSWKMGWIHPTGIAAGQ